MPDGELPPRARWTFEERLLGGTLVWVTLSVIPLASPWPTVPTKQIGLLIGALLLACAAVLRSGAQVTAVLRAAPLPVQIALGSLWAWILWQFLTIAGSPTQDIYEGIWGNSARGAGALTKLALAVLATACVTLPSLAGGRALLRAFRVTVLCVGVYSTLQAFGIDFTQWDLDARYVGTFGNINQSSSFYAFATAVLAAQLLASDRWARRERSLWFDGALFAWMLALCLRTANQGSRQGLFLIACGATALVFSYGFAHWRRHGPTRRNLLLVLGGAALIGGGAGVQLVRSDHGATDRFAFWTTAVEIAAANPLRGVGVSQVPYTYHVYQTPRDAMSDVFRQVDEVHSGPLQQADELGIPGLIAYLGFFAALLPICFMALSGADLATKAAAAGWFMYALQETFSPFSLVISMWGFACAGIVFASYRPGAQAGDAGPALERVARRSMLGRWLVVAAIAGIAAWGLVPRIASEIEFMRVWNVGRLNDGSEAAIRVQVQVRDAIVRLEPIVALRPYDYEWRQRIAFLTAMNGDLLRSARISQEGLRTKPTALQLRDLYAEIELTHGNPSTALAQYETGTVQFPRSLWLALLRRIAAETVGDSARTRTATAHVDSLGSAYRIPADSMRILHKKVSNGLVVTARRMIPR